MKFIEYKFISIFIKKINNYKSEKVKKFDYKLYINSLFFY